jgi:hypothetical protein
MRYRIGQAPDETGAPAGGEYIAVGVFGIVLGIGFVIAGFRARQPWLASLGALLTLASGAYVFVSVTGML